MLHTFRINFTAVEDKLTVSFYSMKTAIDNMAAKFEVMPITEIADYCISGSYIPKYSDSGSLYLRGQNIRNFDLNLNEKDIVYIGRGISIPDKIRVKEKDIVILRTTSSESNIGNASIVPSKYDGSIISQHVTKVGVSKINPYFVLSFLNSRHGKFQLLKAGYGSTRLELTHPELRKVLIPIIDSEQQLKIADLLKQAETKSIQALEKIRQAQNLFIQALDIDLSRVKKENFFRTRFKDLDDMWTPKFYYPLYRNTFKETKKKFETIKLCDISASISKGDEVGSENYKRYLEKADADVSFIRTSDIVNYEIDNYPDFYISQDIYNELNQDLKPGDILFTKDGKIGLSAMLTDNDKCILASGIATLRITKGFSPYYVFTVLSTQITLYQALQRTVTAATIPHLRPDRLIQIEIPILPEDKQKEISKLVKEAFNLKNEKKVLIKQAKDIVERVLE